MFGDKERFGLSCQEIIEAISTAITDAQEISRLRREYTGYSFDYFHRREIDRAEKSAQVAGEKLAALIDARIEETPE